jgi:hypothetical protein
LATYENLRKKIPAWWDYLREEGYTVDLYGKGGSDNFYSYTQFLKYHQDYDKVIFVITSHTRNSVCYIGDESGEAWAHGTNYDVCRQKKDTARKNNDLVMHNIYSGIEGYQLNTLSYSSLREKLYTALILESIKRIRPDIKFMFAFPFEFNLEGYDFQIPLTSSLIDICFLENKLMNHEPWQGKDLTLLDMRMAHMTTDSIKILYPWISCFLDSDDTWFNFDMRIFRNLKVDKSKWLVPNAEHRAWSNKQLKGKNVNDSDGQ